MRNRTLTVVCALLVAAPLSAQSRTADPRALTLGPGFVADVRGGSAVLWNPANLARRDAPAWSVHAAGIGFSGAAAPIGIASLLSAGPGVGVDRRSDWFHSIEQAGGLSGRVRADVMPLAVTIGSVGFSVHSAVGAQTSLPVDAARLALFGNGDGPGASDKYSLSGTHLLAQARSGFTAAWGFALPANRWSRLHLGVAASYNVGHFMLAMTDNGSVVLDDPRWIHIDVPAIRSGSMSLGSRVGQGISGSFGATWVDDRFTIGASVQDALGSFAWDRDALLYQPIRLDASLDRREAEFDETPLAEAPQEVRDWADRILAAAQLSPRIRVGGSYAFDPITDVYLGVEQSVRTTAFSTAGIGVGAGIERQLGPWFQANAGVAALSDGFALAVGGRAAYHFGAMTVGAAALRAAGRWEPSFAVSFSMHPE